MVDFEFIGKEGIMIQFEDIVSLVGYNIANYLKANNFTEKLKQTENRELLLSYFDREEYDIIKWLSQYDVKDLTMCDYDKSLSAWQPNMLYSYKIFKAAYDMGIRNLKIYSENENDIIKQFIAYYDMPVEYCHTDLKSSLSVNMTFYTSIPKNIKLCEYSGIPLALVIVDDFMYIKDFVDSKYINSLHEKNIFVNFTSILGGGFI